MASLVFDEVYPLLGLEARAGFVIGRGSEQSSVDDVRPSARWLASTYRWQDYKLLADLNLYGKYLITADELGGSPAVDPACWTFPLGS